MEELGPVRENERSERTADACALTIEHGFALQILLAAGAPNSASGLLRLQYEALLRAGWLAYAANEPQLTRAAPDLTAESAAKSFASAKQMLSDLVNKAASEPAIAALVTPLQEIRVHSWEAMNSFVHAGSHPLKRAGQGFPIQLADGVLRNSNGMLFLALGIRFRLGQWAGVDPVRVTRAYEGFEDCMPAPAPTRAG